jgi:hypothetical protein
MDVPDEHVEVAETPLTNLSVPLALLDDDGIEEVECEGQELEIHGLHNTEVSITDCSVEGGQKHCCTQGVSIEFFQRTR